jgi:Raf kinase inhibitor-like YbhB/YbcL family protein
LADLSFAEAAVAIDTAREDRDSVRAQLQGFVRMRFVTTHALLLSVCMAGAHKAEAATMKLTSPSFAHNQPIPNKHAGDGQDVSPALKWEAAPVGTKSFVLICDDPDAMSVAGKVWDHWVIWNIPATTAELPENVEKKAVVLGGVKQGLNSWPEVGYNGPLPPPGHGVHHYHFKLYALDVELSLPARSTKQQVEAAMKGHVLGQAELMGTYERK